MMSIPLPHVVLKALEEVRVSVLARRFLVWKRDGWLQSSKTQFIDIVLNVFLAFIC